MSSHPHTTQPGESTPPRLIFAVLCGFLLLLPFGLTLPGTPSSLKADESAYYMMAMSLAFDGDVRLEEEDTERLFNEFSVRRTRNLVTMSNDGWETVYFGKPHLYSLLAAPFARVAGYQGILCFNLLLLLGMIYMLSRHLGRYVAAGPALFFACLFFLMSTTWNYAFWIQPEILSMFGVAGALFFGLRRPSQDGPPKLPQLWMAGLSGVLLAMAVYNKPYLAPIGLTFLFGVLHHGRRYDRSAAVRWFSTWSAGVALSLAFAAGSAWLLTGSPSTYMGVDRDSVTVCEPGTVPLGPDAASSLTMRRMHSVAVATTRFVLEKLEPDSQVLASMATPPEPPAPKTNNKSWTWIFRIPPVTLGETIENIQYFFIGRHTGLLLYFPFVGVAMFSFLLSSFGKRRSGNADPLQVERWTLLGTSLGIGVLLLLFISWNWQGGGGFLGNRYFVTVVPAFGFLVTRLRPVAITGGALMAGLLLGPSLISPFGLAAPEPTLQAHTRSQPFRFFPLELTLQNVPGYYSERIGGLRLRARKDQWLRRGDAFWTQGMATTDILALANERVDARAFLVTGVTDQPATVSLNFAGDEQTVTVEKGQSKILHLSPTRHRRRHNPNHQVWHVYPLTVTSDRGTSLPWELHLPRNPCPTFVRNDVEHLSFFAGAQVTVLGSAARLQSEVFNLRWESVSVPTTATAGEQFQASIHVTNTSDQIWPASGGSAQVKFSYHWLDATGEQSILYDGRRTPLPTDLEPGKSVADLLLKIDPPGEPGTYTLEIDPVFEYVGWFSDHGVPSMRQTVVVEAPVDRPPVDEPTIEHGPNNKADRN